MKAVTKDEAKSHYPRSISGEGAVEDEGPGELPDARASSPVPGYPAPMLGILVADDHELLRMSLRAVLEEHPGWRVCGEAENGSQAVSLAKSLRPDVAILDLRMPELSGLEAARRIRQLSPGTEVLILTGNESAGLLDEAISAGARGLALKTGGVEEVVRAVEALEHHRAPGRGAPACGSPTAAADEARSRRLTPRELEIAQLLAEGKTNLSVGTILGISVKTVETHRANILMKLGLESVAELVLYAVRNHIIEI